MKPKWSPHLHCLHVVLLSPSPHLSPCFSPAQAQSLLCNFVSSRVCNFRRKYELRVYMGKTEVYSNIYAPPVVPSLSPFISPIAPRLGTGGGGGRKMEENEDEDKKKKELASLKRDFEEQLPWVL